MTIQRISIDDAYQKIMHEAVTLVDVRDVISYQNSHITNAIHLSSENLSAFLATTNKNQTLIVYCYHGHSSLAAAEYLQAQGFDKACSMDGGFEAWRLQFPMVIRHSTKTSF